MKKKLISLLVIPILCLFAVCSFHFVKADTALGMVQVNLHTDGRLESSDVLKNMPITLTSTTDASQTFTLTCEDSSNVIKTKKTIPLGDYVVSFQLPENYVTLSGVYTNGPRTDTYVQNGNVVTLNQKFAYNMIYINIKEREEPQPVEKYGKVEVNLHTDGKLVESGVLKNMPVTLVSKEDSTKTYTLNCQDDSNRAELENVPFGEYIVSFDIPEKYEVLDGKVGSGVMGNYLANGNTITIDNEYAYKQLYINVTKKEAPQPVVKYGKVEVNLHTDGKLVESDVLKSMPVTLVSKEDPTKTYTLNCQDDSNRAELENVPFGEYMVLFDILDGYEDLGGTYGVSGTYMHSTDTITIDNEYAYKQLYINVKEKKEAVTDNGSQNPESNENASSSNDSKKQESKDLNTDKKKSKSVKTAVFVNSLFFVSLSLFTGILTILFYKKTKKS
ncbi:MAG: hypothetical protein SPH17_06445 [Faecalicoccus sp.]|uniref:hypothetical protein n=1 Tax=Faecalicoccus sp. TaxID=1971758 RepID=UPI002A90E338|nr:hypothetical protein [Faecalicoccus sp.]MDY5233225.1 hypothetical protein [Faecalicoccus sp.]